MAVRIKCPNPECNATCRIPVSGLGRRLRCGRCGRRFAVSDASPEPTRPVAPPGKGDAQRPASLPGAPHPTSRAHAPAPHAGEAGHRPFINLETVSTYEASGKCGSPVLLILCYPLAIVGGVVGAVLGCAVGAITGFVFAGIACNVADTLFSADVRSAALSIGGSIGGAVGLGIGVFVAGDFARRCSENRNAAVSLCFGVAGTAGLAIIYGVAWYSSAELATLGAWRALALIVILAAGAFATAVLTDRVTSVPYCESCHSCCDKSIAKHFTEKASTIRSNARTGDVQALSALQAVDEAAANAAVVCATCREGCMGYSQIGQAVMVKMEHRRQPTTFRLLPNQARHPPDGQSRRGGVGTRQIRNSSGGSLWSGRLLGSDVVERSPFRQVRSPGQIPMRLDLERVEEKTMAEGDFWLGTRKFLGFPGRTTTKVRNAHVPVLWRQSRLLSR
ncbi:MAG: hypothetical protein LC130_11400 [Bryobacterales bacterium]|nr:hypothetical protein [Bryobacterales bacterium]